MSRTLPHGRGSLGANRCRKWEKRAGHLMQPRVAVIGAGAFGQNHCRVVHESERAQLAAIVDSDAARAGAAAAQYQTEALTDARELAGKIDAAIIAAPTTLHSDIGCALLEAGID